MRISVVAQHLGIAAMTARLWIALRRLGQVRIGRAVLVGLDEVSRLFGVGTTVAPEAK